MNKPKNERLKSHTNLEKNPFTKPTKNDCKTVGNSVNTSINRKADQEKSKSKKRTLVNNNNIFN